MPAPIIASLGQAMTEMTSQPELQKRHGDLGIVPCGQSKQQVKAFCQNDREGFVAAAVWIEK